MTDEIWKAMCRALHEEMTGGAPLSMTPDHLRMSGPCPLCRHRIDPSGFSSVTGKEQGEEVIGLIVCGGCATPLMYREAGKFEVVPKKIMKRISKSTRRFIEKSQALIRSINRTVN